MTARRREWLTNTLVVGLLAALVCWAVPDSRIRLGAQTLRGLIGSYYYIVTHQLPAPTVDITDIYLPGTIRLVLGDVGGTGTHIEYHIWRRDVTGAHLQFVASVEETELGPDRTFLDSEFDNTGSQPTHPFVLGHKYVYLVQARDLNSGGINPYDYEAPPPGLDPNSSDILHYYSPSDWTALGVTPTAMPLTGDQTSDSRLDKRYSTTVYQDFQFGAKTYRGGLFVGKANDPSRVGRTFLKFDVSNLPASQDVFCSSLNLFFVRTFAAGTASVKVHGVVNSATFDPNTLVWTNQPTAATSTADDLVVEWDPSANKTGNYWIHWDQTGQLGSLTGVQSYVIKATDENASAWAYFAKHSYHALDAPTETVAIYPNNTKPATLLLAKKTPPVGNEGNAPQ